MKKGKNGVSLVEIIVAVAVFAIAAVPIYYAISYNAADQTNIGKRSIAQKILESFRDEIKDLEYDYVVSLMGAGANWKSFSSSDMTPNSFNVLLAAQQDFKDFAFSGEVKTSGGAVEILELKVEVTWTSGRGKQEVEKLAFIKVKSEQ